MASLLRPYVHNVRSTLHASLALLAACAAFVIAIGLSGCMSAADTPAHEEDVANRAQAVEEEPPVCAPASDGWTDFSVPGADETIYVSSLNGSDADDGLTEATAKATLAAAYALIETGDPDWILIERGSTLTLPEGFYWGKSGPATPASGYMRLGAYGSGARPVIDCVDGGGWGLCVALTPGFQASSPFTSMALTDLHFTASERLSDGAATSVAATAINMVASQYGGGGHAFRNVLIEGCKFSGWSSGLTSGSDTDDLRIRRNIFTEFYRSTGGEHGNGVLNSGENTLLEENIFYRLHDPSMEQVAEWFTFSHSAYLGAEGSSSARGNIIIRAPEGLMQRNAVAFDRNFVALNHFAAVNTGVAFGVTPHVGGLTPDVTDNLAINNDADWLFGNITGPATVARNMMFKDATSDPDDSVAYDDDFVVWGNADGSGGTNVGVHDTEFEDNWISGTIDHSHAASNTAPHYSGNAFTDNHESVGVITTVIGDYLTEAGIPGADYDDFGEFLIGWEEHDDYTADYLACSVINFYRDAETDLPALDCGSGDSAPTVSAGPDDDAVIGEGYTLVTSCSDDVGATCTLSTAADCTFAGGNSCTCDATACDKVVTCGTEEAASITFTCDDGVSSPVADTVVLDVGDGAPSLILDQMSTAVAVGAWSFNYRLRAAYSGALFRVRDWSSNAEADIGTDSAGEVDLAALSAACCSGGCGDCGVAVVYDQSGGGYNLSQSTESAQPLIVVAAGNKVTGSAGLLAPEWDGVDDSLDRSDSLGLSGDVEIGISVNVSEADPGGSGFGYDSLVFLVGGASSNDGFGLYHDTATDPDQKRTSQVDYRENFETTGNHVAIATFQYNWVGREADDQMQESECYTNGLALTHGSGSDTQELSIAASSQTAWGSQGPDLPAFFFANMRSGFAVVWSNSPTGADKTAFDTWANAQN